MGAKRSSTPVPRRPWPRPAFISLLLALLTLSVYWPVTTFDFTNFDDQVYITGNPVVQRGLTSHSLADAFHATDAAIWHPLTTLTQMLDCQLYGLKAGGHHFTNLLLHAAAVLLLFGLLLRLTGAVWRSAFVAALFALHPLHVESVAWVAERKDVLSACFWMLTLWFYARYARPPISRSGKSRAGRPPATGSYLLSLLCFTLGLLSKPMLVTLPFVLLLLDFWPLQRISSLGLQVAGSPAGNASLGIRHCWRLFLEKIPFFALAAAASVVTFQVQKTSGAVASISGLPFATRLATALSAYVQYIAKLFWPARLAVHYPYHEIRPPLAVAGCLAGLLVACWLVWRQARKHPYLFTGWFWYLGTLVPVIGLVQVGSQELADRYTYIPLIGLFIIIAWGVEEFTPPWPQRRVILGAAAVLIVSACAVTTRVQLQYWRNSGTLFRHVLAVTDDDYVAYGSLGFYLDAIHQPDQAQALYRRSIGLNPGQPNVLLNLGNYMADRRKFSRATQYYLAALRADPRSAQAHYNLGTVLLETGRPDDAIGQFERAVGLQTNYPEAHYELGAALAGKTQTGQAIAHFRAALELKPDWIEPLNNLAWTLATTSADRLRNPAEALALATRAVRLTQGRDTDALDTLAAAQAGNGDYSAAVQTLQEAIRLVRQPENTNTTSLADLQSRLLLYQAGRPYRESASGR